MNPSPRELKRRRRTALMLYMDHRPISYIAQRLGTTEPVVVELLAQAGAKNIQYEGTGTPDPLLEASTMPKSSRRTRNCSSRICNCGARTCGYGTASSKTSING